MDDAFTTDGEIVLCRACNKQIGCSMKSQLQQHICTDAHAKNKAMQSSKKQMLLTQMQKTPNSTNEFFRDMCSAMVAANIPWYKLEVPEYRAFLQKYCGQQIPDESTLRKNYLDFCYLEALKSARRYISNHHIWIAVDETTDVCGRFIANLVVGKLDGEEPSKPILISCKVLERTNHSTVARFVNDSLKVLWPEGIQEEEEEVLVMYSDAASYISPGIFHLLKFAPSTSCDVERSFSSYKSILSDRRHSMPAQNLEKYLVLHCASK